MEIWGSLKTGRALAALGVPVTLRGRQAWYPLRAGLFLELVFGDINRGLTALHERALGEAVEHGLRRALADDAFWRALQSAKVLGGRPAVDALLSASNVEARV